jgi:methylisocitrate lyase
VFNELSPRLILVPLSLVIEGGKTEELSAKDLAEIGFCAVAYPWTLVASHIKSIRETLELLKQSMTVGAPPMLLSYNEMVEGVGFTRYWVRCLYWPNILLLDLS